MCKKLNKSQQNIIKMHRLKQILKKIESRLMQDKYNHLLMVRFEKIQRLMMDIILNNNRQIVL